MVSAGLGRLALFLSLKIRHDPILNLRVLTRVTTSDRP
jgi:hypothetical protein